MTADLDRAAFETWLRAQPPEAVVGLAYRIDCCPLATFRRGKGEPYAVVAYDWQGTTGRMVRRMPDWASQFARAVDVRHREDQPITAADALAVLAEVPA